ncbi:MAG TPA: hypothetical protein VMS17_09880 [Gemmataceae bacterium]|nr:hypothetical protein [Gemmataceae bacterium]
MPPAKETQAIDAITVAAIAVVSYLIAAVVHEGLGHGLTAAALGARGLRLSTAALHLDADSVSPEASRIISIAGPLTGLLVGGLLALIHGATRSKHAQIRYCLWLTAYVCLFANAGYLAALSFCPFGDVHGFVKGLDSPLAWRLALTAFGAAASLAALLLAGRTMDEFLGRNQRRRRAAQLLVISYFAGSCPLILSTLLGRDGSFIALISAIPATLGGTILLLYTILAVGPARPSTGPLPLTPQRSLPWCAAGAFALAVYALVLGPGVPR